MVAAKISEWMVWVGMSYLPRLSHCRDLFLKRVKGNDEYEGKDSRQAEKCSSQDWE
jgi:hypothetical protein